MSSRCRLASRLGLVFGLKVVDGGAGQSSFQVAKRLWVDMPSDPDGCGPVLASALEGSGRRTSAYLSATFRNLARWRKECDESRERVARAQLSAGDSTVEMGRNENRVTAMPVT